MKNITITLDEETARWARIWAAQHNTSVSRFLGEVLTDRMRVETGYDAAKNRFLSKPPLRLRDEGSAYPERESLHDRNSLR